MILLPLILNCKSSFSSKSSTTNVNGTTVPAGCPSSMLAVVPPAEITGVSSITSSILTVRLAVVLSPAEVALHKYEKRNDQVLYSWGTKVEKMLTLAPERYTAGFCMVANVILWCI